MLQAAYYLYFENTLNVFMYAPSCLVLSTCTLKQLCMYLCILQAAIFPSLTASTAVSATPAKSPPQKTQGTLNKIIKEERKIQ